jgi:hypothetical protein
MAAMVATKASFYSINNQLRKAPFYGGDGGNKGSFLQRQQSAKEGSYLWRRWWQQRLLLQHQQSAKEGSFLRRRWWQQRLLSTASTISSGRLLSMAAMVATKASFYSANNQLRKAPIYGGDGGNKGSFLQHQQSAKEGSYLWRRWWQQRLLSTASTIS